VAETGIFRVAELDGRIVALACATMREAQWFLSGFWAAPDLRLQGIGGPLLREVFEEGRTRGAHSFYVWSSIDEAAIAAYMKLGMLPGTQLFTFTGEPRGLAAARNGLVAGEFEHREIVALERAVIGVPREVDDVYWREHGFAARAVRRGGELVGFYYLIDGIVGPCGWTSDEVAADVLGHAIRDAAASHDTVSLTAPGMNHAALRMALASGLRLIRTSHLLWSTPIGDMTRYIPSGPMLF
jgi:acetyltransferase (GNAT) family protein